MQDRRLDQDDNRGLGQGVQDNAPVLNIFRLNLEDIGSCKKRSTNYPAGFLTTFSHSDLNRLLHPMEKLIWHENDWSGVLGSFGMERKSLGTGTELAVLRNLKHVPVSAANKKSTIGLVINKNYLEECEANEERSDNVSIESSEFNHLTVFHFHTYFLVCR